LTRKKYLEKIMSKMLKKQIINDGIYE